MLFVRNRKTETVNAIYVSPLLVYILNFNFIYIAFALFTVKAVILPLKHTFLAQKYTYYYEFSETFSKISFFYKKAKTTTLSNFLHFSVLSVKHRIKHFFYTFFNQKFLLANTVCRNFCIFFTFFCTHRH